MTDELEDLKRRMVLGHKSDGRSVYDKAAKSELVALCQQPGASVSRLARECGVNADQVQPLRSLQRQLFAAKSEARGTE